MPKTGLSPDDLRDKALEVALQQIRVQGVEKVRLAGVAKAMGVSHAALYAYFTDKEALLDAATDRWLTHLEAVVEARLAEMTDPEARLKQWFVQRYVEKRARALADPEPYRAYSLAATTEKVFLRRHIAKMRARLTELLGEAGLGGVAQAQLLQDATQGFNHPALIIAGAAVDRSGDLIHLLDAMIAGIRAAQ
ncbi:MAG: TetR/AcrR family transcriptional regulator [bacterium]